MKNKVTKCLYQATYILSLIVSILFIQCDCGGSDPKPQEQPKPKQPTPVTEDIIQFAKEYKGIYKSDFLANMLSKLKDNPNAVNINEQDPSVEDMTALHFAAIYGNEQIVKALLDRGATANIQDRDHGLPLYYAVRFEHIEIVKLLLDKAEANDLKVKYTNSLTPLNEAVNKGNLSIVTLLVDKGADLYEIYLHGLTPLHLAASAGHVDIVRYLHAEKKVDINLLDQNGNTPLYWANTNSRVDVVTYLTSQGAK